MTAETSNARGELRMADIREDAREPLQLLREKLAHDEDGWAAFCQLMPMLAAAPPPADAEPKTLPVPTHVYLTDKAAVIVGDPQRGWDEEGPDAHNCDDMGCSTIGPHVLARVPFTDERSLAAAQQQGLRIVEPIRNCATPESREAAMVVLETDAEGNPTIWCDPEIADLVRALNVGGVRTKASCSGHGEKPFGIVSLQDGRELLVLPDWETTRRAERILDAGLSAQQQGQAVELAPRSAPVGVRNAILEALNLVHAEGRARVESATAEMADRLAALAQQPAAVYGPYRLVDGVVTVNGIALDEAVKLGDRYAATIEKRGMPRAAQVLEALVMIGRHALAAQHQEPKS